MPRHHGPQTTEIRRAAHRLVDLEILSSFTTSDETPGEYVAVTAAGEILGLRTADALPYLRGLAHGAHVRDLKPHHPIYAFLERHPTYSLDEAIALSHDALDDGVPFCRRCSTWHAPTDGGCP